MSRRWEAYRRPRSCSTRTATCRVVCVARGRFRNTYINGKATTMNGKAGPLIGEVCAGFLPPAAEAVGGLTMGADAIASAMSAYSIYVKKRPLHTFAVRKEPKQHGLKLRIEGVPSKRVVVVDDVVTTGASTIQAIKRCRADDIEVLALIVLVDREEHNGMENVQAEAGPNVPVHAIFKKADLARVYASKQDHDAGDASTGHYATAN
jgi:orotate phosphoribosyltransferase